MKRRTPTAGSYSVVIQPRPSSRWVSPEVPEFDPNWVVRFSMPGMPVKVESSRLPVCETCLADRAAKRLGRDRCACRVPVLQWAEAKHRTLVGLWQQRRIEELNDMLKPKARLKWGPLMECYARSGPKDAADRLASLRLLLESARGTKAEEQVIEELDANHARRFASLYQEYGRRGWSVRGQAPADAWAQLRVLSPQPAIDWETPARWNQTIISVIGAVKGVIGGKSRDRYLHELGELPKLEAFRACSLALPTMDNRQALTLAQYEAFVEALPGLKASDLRAWLMVMLAHLTGLRTIELMAVRTHWLEVDGDEVLLVVRNRPEDGYKMKDSKTADERAKPMPVEVLKAIRELTEGKPGVSVYGLTLPTHIQAVMRAANRWIRTFAPEGPHALYKMRKTEGTVQERTHGLSAAAKSLGHGQESTTRGHYVQPRAVASQVITPEQMRAALTETRRPWAV